MADCSAGRNIEYATMRPATVEIEIGCIDVDGARVVEHRKYRHIEGSCCYRHIECCAELVIDGAGAAGDVVKAIRDVGVEDRARAVVDRWRAVQIELPGSPVNGAIVVPGRAGKRLESTA